MLDVFRGRLSHEDSSLDPGKTLRPFDPNQMRKCPLFSVSLFTKYILSYHLYSLYKARGFSDPAVAKQRINEAIEQIAEKRGISMAQVALAWSLSKEYITAPIVGTTSLDKLKDLLGKFCLFETVDTRGRGWVGLGC